MSLQRRAAGALFLLLLPSLLHAEIVKDNSFLIEEAYNQDPGVVQFIQSYQHMAPSEEETYNFANEIPLGSQTHQFSYVVPVMKLGDAEDETGLGDVLLNYRYQMLNTDLIALAPRFTLIVPTGDYKKELRQRGCWFSVQSGSIDHDQ